MNLTIQPIEESDIHSIVALSLLAWEPVFLSLHHVLGDGIFLLLHPDWRVSQAEAVAQVCHDADVSTWMAVVDGTPAGFVSVKLDATSRRGEIWMVAVHPDYQKQAIGTQLTTFAVDWMRQQGMEVAIVETGGDAGHAAARRTYEKAGFTLLPIARYFMDLTEKSK